MLPGRRDGEGRLDVTTDPVGATSTFQGGIAINPLGQVHIINANPTFYSNGFGVTGTGQLCCGSEATSSFKDGLPRTALNKLKIQTDTVPAATDPFVGGIRVGTLGGVYTTLVAPPVGDMPYWTNPPSIAGVAAVGATLTVTPGTWEGTAPITVTHKWFQSNTPIVGATGLTYVVQSGDYNQDIRCLETATNAVGGADVWSNRIIITTP